MKTSIQIAWVVAFDSLITFAGWSMGTTHTYGPATVCLTAATILLWKAAGIFGD